MHTLQNYSKSIHQLQSLHSSCSKKKKENLKCSNIKCWSLVKYGTVQLSNILAMYDNHSRILYGFWSYETYIPDFHVKWCVCQNFQFLSFFTTFTYCLYTRRVINWPHIRISDAFLLYTRLRKAPIFLFALDRQFHGDVDHVFWMPQIYFWNGHQ